MLKVGVNFDRLWSDPDPTYALAIRAVVDEVEAERLRINAEIEAEAKLRGG